MIPAPVRQLQQGGESTSIFLQQGGAARIGEYLDGIAPGRPRVLVTSHRVGVLWADHVRRGSGRLKCEILIDDGEYAKNMNTVGRLLDELFAAGVQRDWVLIAVGGGVVGDLAGFAASIALRGISVVHIPSTLLSQVDSSIGAKTGVNHAAGKNLIGTFFPPLAVILDPELLRTLSADHVRAGLFEAFKTGVIGDEVLATRAVEAASGRGDLTDIVLRSVSVKVDVVNRDPREMGERRLLNYGHTFGHALELLNGYDGISHGDAVGWGMIAANAMGVSAGEVSKAHAERLDRMIMKMSPAAPAKPVTGSALLEACRSDKKFSGSKRRVIIPREPWGCGVFEASENVLAAGAEAMAVATRNAIEGRRK